MFSSLRDGRGLLFIGVFCFAFFASVVGLEFFAGDALQWSVGKPKSGDLFQHYAAGVLWHEGNPRTLYHGQQMDNWINQWLWEHSLDMKYREFDYVYPPLVAKIASLFAGINYGKWVLWWIGLSMIAYTLGILFLRQLTGKLSSPIWAVVLGMPSFFIVLITLQSTAITFFIFMTAALLLRKKHFWLAGGVISCVFYKPQLLPYLTLFFLIGGSWRTALGIVIGSCAWLGMGMLFCGSSIYIEWLNVLLGMSHNQGFVRDGMNLTLAAYLSPLTSEVYWAYLPGLLIFAGAAVCLRLRKPKVFWNEDYTLWIACTFWLFGSTYAVFYEVLLAIPWWVLFISIMHRQGVRVTLLEVLFWICGFLPLVQFIFPVRVPLTTPFLLLWATGSLAMVLFMKNHKNQNL